MANTFLMKNYYFTIANMVFKQGIGIPMGAGSIPFWGNLFPYFFLSLRMFKIFVVKNQLELLNTMLLVSSWTNLAQ